MSSLTAFAALMQEVCVGKGWCGSISDGQPSHVTDFLPDTGEVTADQFVGWLFAAEGVDPEDERAKWLSHYDGLRDAFVRHMGGESVGVERLR